MQENKNTLFLDMYQQLFFDPTDDAASIDAAFRLHHLSGSEKFRAITHLVWVTNYLDALETEVSGQGLTLLGFSLAEIGAVSLVTTALRDVLTK